MNELQTNEPINGQKTDERASERANELIIL